MTTSKNLFKQASTIFSFSSSSVSTVSLKDNKNENKPVGSFLLKDKKARKTKE